jgi:hypothetical protein
LIAVAGVLALAIGASPALARHHHQARHHRTHHRHHVRLRRFGDLPSQTSGSTSTTPPAAAGTITDMSNGTVTITLTGGGTVTGQVTPDTQVDCPAAQGDDSNDMMRTADEGPGGTSGSSTSGDDDQGDNSQGDDDQGDDDQGTSGGTCTLSVGASVQEAELAIGSGGAVWRSIDLAA